MNMRGKRGEAKSVTKSKWKKKHEFYETSKKEKTSRERQNLCRTRAEWLRSLRQDVAIELTDLHPGDVIEIRKARPKKRRDRALHKWRIGYHDLESGYVELLQEGKYSRKYAEKIKYLWRGMDFPNARCGIFPMLLLNFNAPAQSAY